MSLLKSSRQKGFTVHQLGGGKLRFSSWTYQQPDIDQQGNTPSLKLNVWKDMSNFEWEAIVFQSHQFFQVRLLLVSGRVGKTA